MAGMSFFITNIYKTNKFRKLRKLFKMFLFCFFLYSCWVPLYWENMGKSQYSVQKQENAEP